MMNRPNDNEIAQSGNAGYTRPMVRVRTIAPLLVLLLFVSCSSSTTGDIAMQEAIERPDMSLSDAVYVVDRNSDEPITVHAATVSIFKKSHRTLLEHVTFDQTDTNGDTTLTGSADSIEVDTEHDDVVLRGNIRIDKPDDQFSIIADELSWDQEENRLVSEGDGPVIVTFEGKNRIEGRHFEADFRTATYEFGTIDKGVVKP